MKLKTMFVSALSMASLTAAPLEMGAKTPSAQGEESRRQGSHDQGGRGAQLVGDFHVSQSADRRMNEPSMFGAGRIRGIRGQESDGLGMSTDTPETQKKFQEKNNLPYDLISDPGGKLALKLGIPVRVGKFTARRAMLFKDGKLVWKDDDGATATQGTDVLKAIAEAK